MSHKKTDINHLLETIFSITLICFCCVLNAQIENKSKTDNILLQFNKEFGTNYSYLKKTDSTHFIFSPKKEKYYPVTYGVINKKNEITYKPDFKKIIYINNTYFLLKNKTLFSSNHKKIDNVVDFFRNRNELVIRKTNGMFYLCKQDFTYMMKNFKSLQKLLEFRPIKKPDYKIKKTKTNTLTQQNENQIKKAKNRRVLIEEGILSKVLNNGKFDYKLIQGDENFNIESIDYALVCGVASWSGYTFSIGSKILTRISENTDKKIPVILIDYDFVKSDEDNTAKIFISRFWKHFPSCWVENGQIVKRHEKQQDLEPLIEFIKKRLTELNQKK